MIFSSTLLIAGPSGSGKSTLAQLAAECAGWKCLSLDDYWRGGRRLRVRASDGEMVRTFEDPSLYDGAKLADDIMALKTPCIAEGFCLLHYPEVLKLRARRFYIDLPFGTCLERRMARRPQRPSDASFSKIGEEEMKRWVLPQRDLSNVQVLDGCRRPEELLSRLSVA